MRQPAMSLNNPEGGTNVVDDCCNTDSSVAAGIGKWLYDGLFYSYPAGHRNCYGADWGHSGAKIWINDLLI
jgi:hypothetical protein